MSDLVTERVADDSKWQQHREEILTRRKAMKAIQDALDGKKRTQVWLSDQLKQSPYRLNISPASIHTYFTGQTRVPGNALIAMCLVLGLPLEEILADDIAIILLAASPYPGRGGKRPGAGRPKGKSS